MQAWGHRPHSTLAKAGIYGRAQLCSAVFLEALSPRSAAHRNPRELEMTVAPPCIPLGPTRVSGQDSLSPKQVTLVGMGTKACGKREKRTYQRIFWKHYPSLLHLPLCGTLNKNGPTGSSS